MASIAIYLIILLAAAAVIVTVCVIAYNRRLDKVTRGEARDTHSSIPEPGTTVGAVYRIVLIVMAVITLLTVSTANGRIIALQNNVNTLQSRLNQISGDLNDMKEQIEDSGKRVSLYEWEASDPDFAARTAKVTFSVVLKDYSGDTQVGLNLNGRREMLRGTANAGEYTGQFTVNLFEEYTQPSICIEEEGRTYIEKTDFPDYFFWQFLPIPNIEGRFDSGMKLGRLTYGGEYALSADHTEDIESASVTYVSDGRDLKTMDITKEALANDWITLEKGLDVNKDLSLRFDIVTKTGFRIVQQTVVIFEARPDLADDDYMHIMDLNGSMIWDGNHLNLK